MITVCKKNRKGVWEGSDKGDEGCEDDEEVKEKDREGR